MTRVLPGGTIGILGGGQLGRMLALEGRRMGYRIAVLDPQLGSPAAQLADVHVVGAFDDADAAERLARQSDVLTLDTEHVPVEILERLEAVTPLRPSARILGIVQDRLEQRRFLEAQGAPQVRYAPVTTEADCRRAAASLEFPAILKTRRSGYDGKGQVRVASPKDLADAWEAVGGVPSILESVVDFDKEISVLLARDLHGNVRFHPLAENVHRHHILRTTCVPARVAPEIRVKAEMLGARIAGALGHVGMLAVELFVMDDGGVLVNEIAPRTHNSGHYSFGACATSQFEQHIRAVCGLPLGDPWLLRPAVMLNILGDLWSHGTPDWTPVLSRPEAHLHLYGKQRASPGRKMGHILVFGDDVEQASALAEAIAAALERKTSTDDVRQGAGRG